MLLTKKFPTLNVEGRTKKIPRGESNSRPPPKAFAAALPLQIINSNLWVLSFVLRTAQFFEPPKAGATSFLATIARNLPLVSLSLCGHANVAQTVRQD
jgi:hypothetical protein